MASQVIIRQTVNGNTYSCVINGSKVDPAIIQAMDGFLEAEEYMPVAGDANKAVKPKKGKNNYTKFSIGEEVKPGTRESVSVYLPHVTSQYDHGKHLENDKALIGKFHLSKVEGNDKKPTKNVYSNSIIFGSRD